jgi:ABC-type nitrate/sulfonate/bicarbonate transport system permease component
MRLESECCNEFGFRLCAMNGNLFNPHFPLAGKHKKLLGLGSVLFVLLLWAGVTSAGLISPNKLPSPVSVIKAFQYLLWDPETGRSLLWHAMIASTGRILVAGLIVVSVGIPLGVLMGASKPINAMLSPLIDPFRSAPVVALLPILVMWMGIGETMKIAFLVLGAVVYLIPMVRDAVQAVPQTHWVSARDLGATHWECIRHAVLPLAAPRIFDAVTVCVSVMWTYITVAEYVNAGQGLGQLIQNARRFSAMDQVFAGIIVIILLALLTYQLMTWARQRIFGWETEQ